MAEITKDSTLREVLQYYADKNKRKDAFVTEGVKLFKDIADEKGSAVKLFTPDKTGKTLLAKTLPNIPEEIGLKQPMQNIRQVGLILKGIISPDDKLLETLPDASSNSEKNLRVFGIEEPAKAKSLVTIRVNSDTMNDFFSQTVSWVDNAQPIFKNVSLCVNGLVAEYFKSRNMSIMGGLNPLIGAQTSNGVFVLRDLAFHPYVTRQEMPVKKPSLCDKVCSFFSGINTPDNASADHDGAYSHV